MSNEHETQKEIRGILRLLETTARVVETSPIVDPSESEERCAQQVNNALDRLSEIGAVPQGLFQPLETGASFSEVSVACHQVAAYLREGPTIDIDFDFSNVKKTIGDELKDVSEVVRQSVPDFLKDFLGERTQEKSDTDTVETVEVTSDEDEDAESTTSVDQRIARLEGQMETVVEILQEIRTQQVKQNEEL
ncbi:hypothetical protein F4Y59_02955 [Candidatus Poribacteria bacterium]|nr:hypothetical protein [Candidatus Poribacteria bacterium]MXY27107.1 hypothetical protein [Candidatus Poribacteria bacterium]MYK19718.1 hypothetical protein [Candidatus Poribacteria bacterium]